MSHYSCVLMSRNGSEAHRLVRQGFIVRNDTLSQHMFQLWQTQFMQFTTQLCAIIFYEANIYPKSAVKLPGELVKALNLCVELCQNLFWVYACDFACKNSCTFKAYGNGGMCEKKKKSYWCFWLCAETQCKAENRRDKISNYNEQVVWAWLEQRGKNGIIY